MLFWDGLVKIIMSIIMFSSVVALSFSLFRIPIRGNDKQIVLLALIVGSANYYFKFVVNSPTYMIVQLVMYIVILMLFRKYPLLYSVLVCVTGFLVASVMEVIVSVAVIQTGLSSTYLMQESILHYASMHLLISAINGLASFLIYRFNIGFSFVVRRFSGKNALRGYNFLWAVILVVIMASLQLVSGVFEIEPLYLTAIILLVLGMVISIGYSYIQNQKVIAVRYENRKEDEKSDSGEGI
ncbi:hypothetical protein [Paenibacillus sp. MBLB4367]|uniref:hypothetical protein n=1 Tax=Paenibacillus sp. MBLB4367 TaxID=3384767 RepID=UPI0039083A14